MTVIAKNQAKATRIDVDDNAKVLQTVTTAHLNSDLSTTADVGKAAALSLLSNEGLATPGFKLHGAGFILPGDEARSLLTADPALNAVVKEYRHGRDLTDRPRDVFLIDFGLMTEAEARRYAVPFDIVRSRVKPERDANRREVRLHCHT
jgi:hypothetical protein